MTQIKDNQAGVAHLALVLVLLVVFAGAGAFAYTQVDKASDKKTSPATSQAASQDDVKDVDSGEDHEDPDSELDNAPTE